MVGLFATVIEVCDSKTTVSEKRTYGKLQAEKGLVLVSYHVATDLFQKGNFPGTNPAPDGYSVASSDLQRIEAGGEGSSGVELHHGECSSLNTPTFPPAPTDFQQRWRPARRVQRLYRFRQVHRRCIPKGTGRTLHAALRDEEFSGVGRAPIPGAAGIMVHRGPTAVHGRGIAFGRSATVKLRFVVIYFLSLMLVLVLPGWGQSSAGQDSATTPKSGHTTKKARGQERR